ncbi:MAG TPA: hypothetical protein HPP77_11480, partial [Candidatus Hydrogenedentes bacterium]|nr:hypothetical protein [Candidatus Hydrogenedentota bacterium]
MAQASDSRKLLGDILVEEGALTQEQADAAFAEQAETGGFLGQVLIEMGYIDQASLTAFLAKYCRIPYLSLLNCLVDETLLVLVPKEICLKHRLLPIDKLGKNLTIAIVNPLNKEAVEEVRALCPDLRVKPVVCDWGHFKTVAEQLFKEKLDDTAGGQAAQAACPQAEASAPPMGAADGAVGQGGMSGEAADLAAQEMVAVAEN